MGKLVQFVMVVFAQATRIQINHVFELMQVVLHFDHLIDLFLIFDHGETCAAVIHDIGHLFGGTVIIQRHGDRPDRLRRDHRPIKMRPVAANNGNKIARVHAQIDQAQRKGFNLFLGFCP